MSTITAILTPSPDGTLHLPLPEGWPHRPIRVTAELEPVGPESDPDESGGRLTVVTPKEGCLKGFGCLEGKVWMAPDFDEPLDDFKEYMG